MADLGHLNRNAVNRYAGAIRIRLAEYCEEQSPFGGTVEVDDSYFGPKGIRGKRGRGAGSNTIAFGIFKRNGTVYA